MNTQYSKSGYLNEDFRLFHNVDTGRRGIPLHYHDFHKLFLLCTGNTSYMVEGRQWLLSPGDIVLVRAGWIHRPIMHDDSLYERIIFYIDPDFFRQPDTAALDLFSLPDLQAGPAPGPDPGTVFPQEMPGGTGKMQMAGGSNPSQMQSGSLLRLSGTGAAALERMLPLLKQAAHDRGYAADTLRRARLLELLVLLSRSVRSQELIPAEDMNANPLIGAALAYIHAHLADETLDIDRIAEAVSLGRSYLMHLFKAQIGYTIGQYITEKRLYQAGTLMKSGMPVTQACYQSGFRNYAAFYYAYQQKYHTAPSKGLPRSQRIEGE